jgi:hypothetical protein
VYLSIYAPVAKHEQESDAKRESVHVQIVVHASKWRRRATMIFRCATELSETRVRESQWERWMKSTRAHTVLNALNGSKVKRDRG